MLDLTRFETFYIYTIFASSLAIGGFVIYWIRAYEKKRIQRFKESKSLPAIETESPQKNEEKITEERGLASIRKRYASIRKILVPLVFLLIFLIGVLPLLEIVPSTYVSLVIGVITVIVGIASKPFIENLIAGIVLSIAQPIRVGDTLTISKEYGTVEKIDLLYTTIKIWNWRRLVFPNNIILGKEFVNHTLFDSYEWAKVVFYISPDSDFDLVEKLAIDAMKASSFLLHTEDPSFFIIDIQKDTVECWITGWSENPPNTWSLTDDTRKELLKRLKAAGIKTNILQLQNN